MSFTIPNLADAGFPAQAQIDHVDVDVFIAGHKGDYVVSGCAVTAQGSPDMTVAVAVGAIRINGAVIVVSAGNVTVGAADGTNPRFDLITVNDSGTKACTAGTAAASPVFPSIPANSVVLAAVYVPANDTDIDANQIVDKRVVGAFLANAGYAINDGTFLHGPTFPLTFPPSTGWSNINHQGSDTVSHARGPLELKMVGRGANSFSVVTRTMPATPYTITAGLLIRTSINNTIVFGGIGFRESGTGKLHVIELVAGINTVRVGTWNSPTSQNGSSNSDGPDLLMNAGYVKWFQITHDGTNLKWRWGQDPFDFEELASLAKNNFFTTDADEVCILGQPGDVGSTAKITVIHWAVT